MPRTVPHVESPSHRWAPLAPLVVFSFLYWISAWGKSFHVDEFYSWVYADRCTLREILTMKDTGIGHPPLFHVLQKAVSELIPGTPSLEIRLVNYLVGLLFVLLVSKWILAAGKPLALSIAVAGSAAVLNVFVFARMWGLLSLFSLVVLICGERYVRTADWRFLGVMLCACVLGYASDFSFVLTMPYVFLVLSSRRRTFPAAKVMYGGLGLLLFTAMIFRAHLDSHNADADLFFRWANFFPLGFSRLVSETARTLIHFSFFEPFFFSVALITGVVAVGAWHRHRARSSGGPHRAHLLTLFIFLFVCLDGADRFLDVRSRYLALISVSLALAFLAVGGRRLWRATERPERIFHSVLGGLLIVLIVNPFFWRSLLDLRYISLMLPFLLIWVTSELDRRSLGFLAAILIGSGVLFASSNVVSDMFFPAYKGGRSPDLYFDAGAYANHYLRGRGKPQIEPVFPDMTDFDRYCRVCRMGRVFNGPAASERMLVIGRENAEIRDFLEPYGLLLQEETEVSLSTTDRIQFRLFRPMNGRRYLAYEFIHDDGIQGRTESHRSSRAGSERPGA